MSLEPRPQFRRNLEALNELIAGRYRILLFHLLHDLRITLGKDVKRELAYRLGARCRRRNASEQFECAGIVLRSRPTRKNKGAQHDTYGKNGCFSHVKIVTEMENQKAQVPLDRILVRHLLRTYTPAYKGSDILCRQQAGRSVAVCSSKVQRRANNRKHVKTAIPARSNPATTRNSREEGTVGIGPGGRFGGNA